MAHSPTDTLPSFGVPPVAPGATWSGHAFGVDLKADFAVAGLPPSAPLDPAGRHTSLRLYSQERIAAEWDDRSPERLVEWRDAAGVQGGLDVLPELGYRFEVKGYGTFSVSPDGRFIRCAPPPGGARAGAWEECLLGQVLPLAAVLRGVEVLHASAVSLGDRVAAFVGVSTAGKTSLAVNLVARGATLMTDDVLGIKVSDERLRCFPGAAAVSLRHAEAAAMGERWRRLGEVYARGPDSVKLVVDRDNRPLPLTVLYFLDRDARDQTRIQRIEAGNPRQLLASSFNFVLRDRARLVNQLDVFAAISAHVPQFRVSIGSETDAGALSEAILAHIDRLGTCGAA